jgi:hypothetical protein
MAVARLSIRHRVLPHQAESMLMTSSMKLTTALWIAVSATGVNGQMFVPTGAGTLRGLPGVEVIVERFPQELEMRGLTSALVRADVEARLVKGGITIYPTQTVNLSPAKPYLYVSVNALTLPDNGGYALGVQLHLRQTVRSVVTESNIVDAMTWDAHNVLAVPTTELPAVRTELLEFVDQFISDWNRVH